VYNSHAASKHLTRQLYKPPKSQLLGAGATSTITSQAPQGYSDVAQRRGMHQRRTSDSSDDPRGKDQFMMDASEEDEEQYRHRQRILLNDGNDRENYFSPRRTIAPSHNSALFEFREETEEQRKERIRRRREKKRQRRLVEKQQFAEPRISDDSRDRFLGDISTPSPKSPKETNHAMKHTHTPPMSARSQTQYRVHSPLQKSMDLLQDPEEDPFRGSYQKPSPRLISAPSPEYLSALSKQQKILELRKRAVDMSPIGMSHTSDDSPLNRRDTSPQHRIASVQQATPSPIKTMELEEAHNHESQEDLRIDSTRRESGNRPSTQKLPETSMQGTQSMSFAEQQELLSYIEDLKSQLEEQDELLQEYKSLSEHSTHLAQLHSATSHLDENAQRDQEQNLLEWKQLAQSYKNRCETLESQFKNQLQEERALFLRKMEKSILADEDQSPFTLISNVRKKYGLLDVVARDDLLDSLQSAEVDLVLQPKQKRDDLIQQIRTEHEFQVVNPLKERIRELEEQNKTLLGKFSTLSDIPQHLLKQLKESVRETVVHDNAERGEVGLHNSRLRAELELEYDEKLRENTAEMRAQLEAQLIQKQQEISVPTKKNEAISAAPPSPTTTPLPSKGESQKILISLEKYLARCKETLHKDTLSTLDMNQKTHPRLMTQIDSIVSNLKWQIQQLKLQLSEISKAKRSVPGRLQRENSIAAITSSSRGTDVSSSLSTAKTLLATGKPSIGTPPLPPPGGAPPPPPPPGGAPPPPPPPPGKLAFNKKRALSISSLPVLPERAPSIDTKPVHLTSLNTKVIGQTIWIRDKIAESTKDIELDTAELEKLFENKKSDNSGGGTGTTVKKSTRETAISLLDGQRHQNISMFLIGLKHKNTRPIDLVHQILKMDNGALSLERLSQLKAYVPTTDEILVQRSFDGDVSQLDQPDQFFRELMKLPRLEQRINAWIFTRRFEEMTSENLPKIQHIFEASDYVQKNEHWKQLLALILAVSNFLNGTNKRKVIHGFRMSSLSKLKLTKSMGDARITLLQYIVRMCREKYPEIYQIDKEMITILQPAAKDIFYPGLVEDLEKVKTGMQSLVTEIKWAQTSPFEEDRFESVMSEFHDTASGKVQEMESKHESMSHSLKQLSETYGESNEEILKDPGSFFGTLLDFLQDWKRARLSVEKMQGK